MSTCMEIMYMTIIFAAIDHSAILAESYNIVLRLQRIFLFLDLYQWNGEAYLWVLEKHGKSGYTSFANWFVQAKTYRPLPVHMLGCQPSARSYVYIQRMIVKSWQRGQSAITTKSPVNFLPFLLHIYELFTCLSIVVRRVSDKRNCTRGS